MDRDFFDSLTELRHDLMQCDPNDLLTIRDSLLTLVELLQEREERPNNNSGSAAREG